MAATNARDGWPALFTAAFRSSSNAMGLVDEQRCHVDVNATAWSRREREIVDLVALGYSGPEIAEQLDIGHETVRTHIRNAMAKTGARSRAHLVAKALADGAIVL